MKPKVWVIGFPRCGTVSLCEALSILGWNPIHNPRNLDMLDGRDSGGDVLVTEMWWELLQMFPDSKFILNTRDFDSWTRSLKRIPGFWSSPLMWDAYYRMKVYGTEDVNDKMTLREKWDYHHCEVQQTIPRSQLLTLELPFQWEELCHFLNVPVPDCQFPWKNNKSCSDVLTYAP